MGQESFTKLVRKSLLKLDKFEAFQGENNLFFFESLIISAYQRYLSANFNGIVHVCSRIT